MGARDWSTHDGTFSDPVVNRWSLEEVRTGPISMPRTWGRSNRRKVAVIGIEYASGSLSDGQFYGVERQALRGKVVLVKALLVWMYRLAVIMLFGCEFNAARERAAGTIEQSGRSAAW
jgi:hypothetical protein